MTAMAMTNAAAEVPEIMDPDQLAAYLNVPVATVYAWRARGRGPRGARVGRHVRYRRVDVDAWLSAGGRDADADSADEATVQAAEMTKARAKTRADADPNDKGQRSPGVVHDGGRGGRAIGGWVVALWLARTRVRLAHALLRFAERAQDRAYDHLVELEHRKDER